VSASVQTRGRSSRRSALVNAVAATAFLVGGSLFAIGAALAQAGVNPTACATIYLVGGVFFSTGGYASVVQVRDEPRLQRTSAVVLFAGTIVFAINLVDSFIQELTPAAFDRLVWSPDMIGCALFLVSGHLAMAGIAGGFWRVWRRRDLGWWIIAVNQLGSILFMVSAAASFVRPSSGDMVATGIANWGTLLGALCFAIAGLMQEFEHPLGPRRRRAVAGPTDDGDAPGQAA
jgi:hypothetical protein